MKKAQGDLDHAGGPVDLLGARLTISDVIQVARERRRVSLLSEGGEAQTAEEDRIWETARWVHEDLWTEEEAKSAGREKATAYYGINTGIGALAGRDAFEKYEDAQWLSRNVITSHSVGVGEYFAEDVVRAALLVRARGLSQGFSGVRPKLINTLIQMLNKDVYPAIPKKGSVGASGDPAPLAHLALVLSRPPDGEDRPDHSGEAFIDVKVSPVGRRDAEQEFTVRRRVSGLEAMQLAGMERIVLGPKEGLALINSTAFSAAMAALAVHDAFNLLRNAEIALAMSLEATHGFRDAFLPHIHLARGHQGQIDSARTVLELIRGSSLVDGSADENPKRRPPQDAYSLRCAPVVLGSVRETLQHVSSVVEKEINGATENPLIFLEQDNPEDPYYLPRSYKVVSGGNFHGEPIALAMDFLGIAMAGLGSIAERRIFRLLDDNLSRGLPGMLVDSGRVGLGSGLMLVQYTAAALVSENKTLAHPDSVDSIPTCANQEEHVSMSANAVRHALEIIWNTEQIIAIEMLCAVQALEFRLKGLSFGRTVDTFDVRDISARIASAKDDLVTLIMNPTDEGRAVESITLRRDEAERAGLLQGVDADGNYDRRRRLTITAQRYEGDGLKYDQLGQGTRKAYEFLRAALMAASLDVTSLSSTDQVLYPYIRAMAELVRTGSIVTECYPGEYEGRP